MIAKRKDATPAPLVLAWLLAQHSWIVPIPGTPPHRLEENLRAVELSPDDLGEIAEVASKIEVQGARYPNHLHEPIGT